MLKQRQRSARNLFLIALISVAALLPAIPEAKAEIISVRAEPAMIEAASSTSQAVITLEADDVAGVAAVTIDLSPFGMATSSAMSLATGTAQSGIWELPVASDVVGNFDLLVTVESASGSSSTSTVGLSVEDTTAPEITLLGSDPMTVLSGEAWVDPGAEAWDAVDGELDVSATSTIDTDTTGIYQVVYTATDESGNQAAAQRTVIVAAATGTLPVFTELQATPQCVAPGSSTTFRVGVSDADGIASVSLDLSDLGSATASPMSLHSGTSTDGVWTLSASTSAIGLFLIPVSAEDRLGNTSTSTIELRVSTTTTPATGTLPVFTELQATPQSVAPGSSTTFRVGVSDADGIASVSLDLSDLGSATASPMSLHSGTSTDGVWTLSASTSAIGLFLIPVSAEDRLGNTSTSTIELRVSTTTLAAPTGLAADTATFGRIRLSWNQIPGASAYHIYSGSTSSPIASTSGTEYLHNNVIAGSVYTYWVTAVGSDGQRSPFSGPISATARAQTDSGGAGFFGIFLLTPIEPKEIENWDVPMSISERQAGVYHQRSGSNRLDMRVPKGAVTGKAVFTIEPMDGTGMIPGNATLVGGKIYDISAVDGNGRNLAEFSDLEFLFYLGDHSSDARDIGAYSYDPAASRWNLINGLWYDQEDRSFSLKTGHLSAFALFKAAGLPRTLPVQSARVGGQQAYANGTLLKASDNRIYVVENGRLIHIPNLDELRRRYSGRPINMVGKSTINLLLSGSEKPAADPVREKEGPLPIQFADLRPYYYGDGNLLRDASTGKIFLIGGNGKKHIKTLSELAQYRGKPVYPVDSSVLSAYTAAETVTMRSKPYADGSLLKVAGGQDIYIVENGGKRKLAGPSQLKKYAQAKIYKVSAEALARYPLLK